MQGKRNEWVKQAKGEDFSTSLDDHINAKKMQLRPGSELTEEDVVIYFRRA